MSASNDLNNLYESLALEIAAVARYKDHQAKTPDPAILALLQGLMRNEEGHKDGLIEQITRLKGNAAEASKLPKPTLAEMVYEGEQVRGQKTNLAMLRADLAFESEATRLYHEFATQAEDNALKSLFIELSRAERGHVNGLRFLLKAIEEGAYEVAFFCPVCGWSISFGQNPEPGWEARCRMCGVAFALEEKDGDFALQRK
jgi:rubrerythrin